jgi:co-chaperonin GroES (HSP10)
MPNRVQGKIIPLKKRVLVSNMHFGDVKTKGGVILLDDDGKADGTHPRWAKVYAVGRDQKDVHVGEWVLVAHGRWTCYFRNRRSRFRCTNDRRKRYTFNF